MTRASERARSLLSVTGKSFKLVDFQIVVLILVPCLPANQLCNNQKIYHFETFARDW